MKLKNYVTLAVTACITATTPAFADKLDDIMRNKKLRVGIDLSQPSFGQTDEKMKPVGFDVETAALLAKDLGVELELIPTTAPTRIPNLQTNKADLIISTLSITPARAKVVDFSLPYGAISAVVAAPKGMNIKGYGDLAGKKVAVTRSATQDTDMTANAKGAQIVRFDDDATTALAGATGQVDVVALTPMMVQTIMKKNPERQFEIKFVMSNTKLGIGIAQGEPKLVDRVNVWVKANLKNGKLAESYKRNVGFELPQIIIDGAN